MIQVYFKQAWQLLKQNKLYSGIYIIGTGMAIAMIMTVALIYYIKIASVYPETNRDRTMILQGAEIEYLEGGSRNAYLSYQFVKNYLLPLHTPQEITAVYETWMEYPVIDLPSGRGSFSTTVKYVDDKFWKVFNFKFLDGKPFAEAEFQSGIKTAVISAALSNILFGTSKAEGEYMHLDGNDYRISGVVEDVSFVIPDTYSEVWVPFTVNPEAVEDSFAEGLLGSMKIYILAATLSDMKKIKEEVLEVVQKINNSQQNFEFNIYDQPTPYWQNVFRQHTSRAIDWAEIFKSIGIILVTLLIVPAINLAGLVSSRMEKRLPEMCLRKSFGANRGVLLNQILTENLVLTVLGGLVGLILSYILLYTSSSWIFNVLDNWPDMAPEDAKSFLTAGMLVNPVVFLMAFGICFILNFLSAIIPAFYGLRKNIVYSLSNNK